MYFQPFYCLKAFHEALLQISSVLLISILGWSCHLVQAFIFILIQKTFNSLNAIYIFCKMALVTLFSEACLGFISYAGFIYLLYISTAKILISMLCSYVEVEFSCCFVFFFNMHSCSVISEVIYRLTFFFSCSVWIGIMIFLYLSAISYTIMFFLRAILKN